jgi:hypothetical protein
MFRSKSGRPDQSMERFGSRLRASLGARGHRTLSMNLKSPRARENSDASAGSAGLPPRNDRESDATAVAGQKPRAPRFFPCHARRRTIQGPSKTMSGGCAAGENDRREALRFPALRFRNQVSDVRCQYSCGREAPGKCHRFRARADSWRECDCPGSAGRVPRAPRRPSHSLHESARARKR